MIKLTVKIVLQLFFWRPKKWRKGLKAKLESALYSIAIRRRAKSCGGNLYILGPGVSVTANTTIGDGAGFGKNVKIFGDGPVSIGRRAAIAEDTLVYTQVHDYDHSEALPFGWDFTYPETRIDDYAWVGVRCIVLPSAHNDLHVFATAAPPRDREVSGLQVPFQRDSDEGPRAGFNAA